jgi:hypothetical protein
MMALFKEYILEADKIKKTDNIISKSSNKLWIWLNIIQ